MKDFLLKTATVIGISAVIVFCCWLNFKWERLKHPDAPWWTLILK